jgi:hypothetical protein
VKALIAALLCVGLSLAGPALAQGPTAAEKKQQAAEKKQQARVKSCGQQAGRRQGRERQAFVTACLKGAKPGRARR